MLVVVAIIAAIISVVLLVGGGAITGAKAKDTRVMLEHLNTAIDAFSKTNPYKSTLGTPQRYGAYPPDELMAFDPDPGPGMPPNEVPNLMPGGIGRFVKIGPGGGQPISPIHDDYVPGDEAYVQHGAVKALVWALRSVPASRELFDAISDRFKVTASIDEEFFDRNGNGKFDSMTDRDVMYIVDGWGNPIEYFAAKELDSPATSHNWVGSKLRTANKNLPVLVSYGPDGKTQVRDGRTLESLYNDNSVNSGDPMFAGSLHDDNIYLDDAFSEKIATIRKP